MKLVVFGSTGSIGREFVEKAIEDGHTVTAFTRNPAKIESPHANLQIVQGDVMDLVSVEKAVPNQDTVICLLGAGNKGSVRSEGTRNIILAMEKEGVRRLICLSTIGVGDSWNNINFFWKYIVFGMIGRKAYADHVNQEKFIKESNIDWTIVRSGAFTDGDRTDNYRHGFPTTDRSIKMKISRPDVVRFMLNQLVDDMYIHQAPGISY